MQQNEKTRIYYYKNHSLKSESEISVCSEIVRKILQPVIITFQK